jgi:multicomponent Na+:H+ antiporter subunit D
MTASVLYSPGMIVILGAFLMLVLPARAREWLMLALPGVALILVWMIPDGGFTMAYFVGWELDPVRGSPEARLFATVFLLAAGSIALYGLRQAPVQEIVPAYLYGGAAVGVLFAGDLLTLFIFWEVMAVGSTLVLWSAGTESARRAGMRYVVVHLFGGVLLFAGIAAHASETGSLLFEPMQLDGVATGLILAGFLVNAGAPPFSSWIADAYPEASPSGTVFLSSFTTKTAVFVLMVGFAGTPLLIAIGLFMVFYGLVYALLENDIRRMLAFATINQVGFMIVGVGIGTELALNGVTAHAFAHIIYKALLLMAAGSVLYMTGIRRLSDLGGLRTAMPLTAACAVIGGLTIAGLPLTSGFVTKSLITGAAAQEHLTLAWTLLTLSSTGVFLAIGLLFPYLIFFRDRPASAPTAEVADPPLNMRLAMLALAVLCILVGIVPWALYGLLPYPVHYTPFALDNVLKQIQIMAATLAAFLWLRHVLARRPGITLDFDWFYRRLGVAVGNRIVDVGASVREAVEGRGQRALESFTLRAALVTEVSSRGTVGRYVLIVVSLLAVVLIFNYL